MVTKTRKKLNDYAYGSRAPVHDSSTWSGESVSFQVQGTKGVTSVTLRRNNYPDLYDAFINRKNIDVELEDKIYGPKDIQKLKDKLLSGYDVPSKEEYAASLENLKQAHDAEHHAFDMGNLARQLTYDLADAYEADKFGKRYETVVKYAEKMMEAIAKDQPFEEVKEPNRGMFNSLMDNLMDRDSLQHTKKNLRDFFDKDSLRKYKKDFVEMAQNIPSEPMKSRVSDGKNADKSVKKFMDIYDQRSKAASDRFDDAHNEFVVVLAKREIVRAAERTLEVKIKAHNDRMEKEQKKEKLQEIKKQKYAENAKRGKEMQKTVHRMRSATEINSKISARERKSDRSK